MSCRRLELEDLSVVAELMTSSFEPGLSPYMVGTQHGWPKFIELVLEHPQQFPAQLLMVAELEGRVVAFADFRVPGDGTGFLSYICVAPSARRRGVGGALMGACVQSAGELHKVSLDVFEENKPARALYDSLGFSVVETYAWWRAPLTPAATNEGVSLTSLPASLASLDVYGFCELTGMHGGRAVRCGRMGRSVLRLFDVEDFDDLRLEAALAGEFPELNESFAVLPGDRRPSRATAELFNSALRMTTHDVSVLLPRPERSEPPL